MVDAPRATVRVDDETAEMTNVVEAAETRAATSVRIVTADVWLSVTVDDPNRLVFDVLDIDRDATVTLNPLKSHVPGPVVVICIPSPPLDEKNVSWSCTTDRVETIPEVEVLANVLPAIVRFCCVTPANDTFTDAEVMTPIDAANLRCP